MDKIKLEITSLSYSQTQSGAYALVLKESKGRRRLPIIIGGFEAQAIAIKLEGMTPSRPLSHDLFKNFADNFNITLNEIIIYNLVEGIFFAKLICEQKSDNNDKIKEIKIDSRTSDAIALAVRFDCPIYTYETVLNSAGIILDDDDDDDDGEFTEENISISELKQNPIERLTLEELNINLNKAIETEDYEQASKIRDELKRRNIN
jgi:hypothetical protein